MTNNIDDTAACTSGEKLETVQYHIRVSKTLPLFRQCLVEKLRQNRFVVAFSEAEPSVIEIPSLLHDPAATLGVFWMNQHSFKQLSLEILFQKISDFMEKYPSHILLLENYQLCEQTCDSSLLCGFWAYLALNWGCGCIPLRNEQDFLLCLTSLAKREQIRDKPPSLARIKDKTESMEDARLFFLQGFINCGEKKAQQLLTALKSPVAIIDDLAIHNGQAIMKMEGFGPRFVADNHTLLTKKMNSPESQPLDTWTKPLANEKEKEEG